MDTVKNYPPYLDSPKPRKKQTNGDHIRAMSDEELGNFLGQFADLDVKIDYCKNTAECEQLLDTEEGIPAEKCAQCMLEWLRQTKEDI